MPATAMPVGGGRAACRRSGLLDRPPDVGGQRLEVDRGGRVGGDVALGVADDPGLERGVEADLGSGADDQLGRAAADVDHQRRLARRLLRGGAEVGEPRLLLAAEHPRREREALAQLGDEGVAVGGVAHRAGRDRHDGVGFGLLVERHVVGDRLAGRLDRLRGELAGEVDATAEPRHPAAPLDLGDRPDYPRRRSAAGSSWCRCRRPRPVWNPLAWTRHSICRLPSRC